VIFICAPPQVEHVTLASSLRLLAGYPVHYFMVVPFTLHLAEHGPYYEF